MTQDIPNQSITRSSHQISPQGDGIDVSTQTIMQPQQSVIRQGGKQLHEVTTQTTMQPQQADNQTQETQMLLQGNKQDILAQAMTQGNVQPSDTTMLTNEMVSEDT